MDDAQALRVVESVFSDSNLSSYMPLFSAYRNEVIDLASSLGAEVLSRIEPLVSSSDPVVQSIAAQKTAQFLTAATSENWISSVVAQRTIIFCSELCVLEPMSNLASMLSLTLTAGNLWLALIHFESPEDYPPFTTNYMLCEETLRKRYVVHSCIDYVFPAHDISDVLMVYAVENFERINEICWAIQEYRSTNIALLQEVLHAPTRSLSSGIL